MTRPTRSREIRAARHQVQAMKHGDFDDDYTSHIEDLAAAWDDSPLPLKDGSQQDLRQPWQMPEKD